MNKNLENIYNNNFRFTNFLIMKKRKQNQISTYCLIALFPVIIVLTFKLLNENFNSQEERKSSCNKKNEITNISITNNRKLSMKNFASSIVLPNFNPTYIDFKNKSFNFLNILKNNFLTEICFPRYLLLFQNKFGDKEINQYFLSSFLMEDFLSVINKFEDISYICVNHDKIKILVKYQSRSYKDKFNHFQSFNEIEIYAKNISSVYSKNNKELTSDDADNPGSYLITHFKKLFRNIYQTKLNGKETILNLYILICNTSRNSYDLEIYFNFHFYKISRVNLIDRVLSHEIKKNYPNDSKIKSNSCLNNDENKIAIISRYVPKCLEFVNFRIKNLPFLNYSFEIDIFIYDLKSENINLFFIDKVIINKRTGSYSPFSDDIIGPNAIIYKYHLNLQDINLNFRICDFVSFQKLSKRKIKMKGIYLEWNIIKDDSLDEENNHQICFDNVLTIED